jgi:hypothetical protein
MHRESERVRIYKNRERKRIGGEIEEQEMSRSIGELLLIL